MAPGAVVGLTLPAADAFGSGGLPTAAELAGIGTTRAAGDVAEFDEATGAAEEADPADAGTLTPHCETGLFPGSFDSSPKMVSLIGDWMLQVSPESLSPPMRPGH